MSDRTFELRGRHFRLERDGQSAKLLAQHPSGIFAQVSGHEAVGILAELLDAMEDAALEVAEASMASVVAGRLL